MGRAMGARTRVGGGGTMGGTKVKREKRPRSFIGKRYPQQTEPVWWNLLRRRSAFCTDELADVVTPA